MCSVKLAQAPIAGSTKDLGRWKPQDDLQLINAVQQASVTSFYLANLQIILLWFDTFMLMLPCEGETNNVYLSDMVFEVPSECFVLLPDM